MSERMTGFTAKVEVEEDVYSFEPANNGSGPFWCYGHTCIVRRGEKLFVSGLETLPDIRPESYNNVRWLLFRRDTDAWELLQKGDGRTREPCPLGVVSDGRLFMSDNPTLAPVDALPPSPARPEMLVFSTEDPRARPRKLLPDWGENPGFTEHSYRAMAVDADTNEILAMNINGYTHFHWSLLDAEENWTAHGRLEFPWGTEYEEPKPIRICYPELVLNNRAVHFMGISDVVEPVRAWKQARFEVTQRVWDYDFRRLFYTYTPDIGSEPFTEWVEIASREETAGHISNLDLWLASDGAVHVLWAEQSCDPRIRERFFPEVRLTVSLNHGILRGGTLVECQTLCEGDVDAGEQVPLWGRFHITPDNRLFVYYSIGAYDRFARDSTANYLVEVTGQLPSPPVEVRLEQPLHGAFMTATPRGGSPTSNTLDLLGTGSDPQTVRYVRMSIG